MPPFSHVLSDSDIAAVISYIRGAWGNAAEPVSAFQVQQYRSGRAK
jgi:mono/diheme cytochrome c family protein